MKRRKLADIATLPDPTRAGESVTVDGRVRGGLVWPDSDVARIWVPPGVKISMVALRDPARAGRLVWVVTSRCS